jgi:ribosomal protein S18 acetylase RimI-like enzyme
MRIRKASPAQARRQADWIAAIDPWRGLGYRAPALGRWLRRVAGRGWVRVAVQGDADEVIAVMVLQPEFLLGSYISLLAVRPDVQGRGAGRALVAAAERAERGRRWLYTSSDARNRAAALFYGRLGFSRIGRLPGLIRDGRTEILWRRLKTPL